MTLGRRPTAVAGAAALAAFLGVGLVGANGYVGNFLRYRGFDPPQEPAFVTRPGTLQRVNVSSPALGGRRQEVYVYLPPGYAQQPRRRYAVLYLLGYPRMTIEEIKRFRQFGSLRPGHPENFVTPGVETTTGPLGQGLANAVGMAIAEAHLSAEFGRELVDHHTYVLASDGDLMEGIRSPSEASTKVW